MKEKNRVKPGDRLTFENLRNLKKKMTLTVTVSMVSPENEGRKKESSQQSAISSQLKQKGCFSLSC